jgi:hypothetical protein
VSDRELLLTGTLPLSPASSAFKVASERVGSFVRRLPDGEQGGWVRTIWAGYAQDPCLEPIDGVAFTHSDTPFRGRDHLRFALSELASDGSAELQNYTLAASTIDSYQQFRALKSAGAIDEAKRFQATLPGPLTAGSSITAPLDTVLALVEPRIAEQIAELLAAIPAEELTLQLDLAVEAEIEEYRRRPSEIDMPWLVALNESLGNWTIEPVIDSIARLVNVLPAEVELGFHICGAWHIDHRCGQDLRVHVDIANLLSERIGRSVDYIHMPTIPEHDADDFKALENLRLAPATTLFLGLLHLGDGIAGAARRIEAAAQHRADFGIGHFCGLGPSFGIGPENLDEALELHVKAAKL